MRRVVEGEGIRLRTEGDWEGERKGEEVPLAFMRPLVS